MAPVAGWATPSVTTIAAIRSRPSNAATARKSPIPASVSTTRQVPAGTAGSAADGLAPDEPQPASMAVAARRQRTCRIVPVTGNDEGAGNVPPLYHYPFRYVNSPSVAAGRHRARRQQPGQPASCAQAYLDQALP